MNNVSPNARQFAFHDRVPPATPPVSGLTALLNKAFTDEPLTRDEKDQIAHALYGTFGSGSSRYRLLGWEWRMREAKQMRRILVSFDHDTDTFKTYFAPDKTALRAALGDSISEMIYLGQPNDTE